MAAATRGVMRVAGSRRSLQIVVFAVIYVEFPEVSYVFHPG